MEKQLGRAHNLGGVESLGISKVGQIVLAKLMESQIWHQPTSSMWGELSVRTMAFTRLDARHYSLSLYTTGALQAATLMLKLRGGESE